MRNKLLTMRNAVLAVLSAVIIACLALGIVALPGWARADGEASGVFTYDADDDTVITGLTEEAAADPDLQLVIPANVTAIAEGAFLGCENLTRVSFEEGSVLNEIGEMAFAGCSSLNNIELPASADSINYGADVFEESGTKVTVDGDVSYSFYIIAKDKAECLALTDTESGGLREYAVNVTYPVTIRYISDNVEIATEKRLYNTDYRVQLNDNLWKMSEIETVGPDSHSWYYEENLATAEIITELLGGDSLEGEITLYSFDTAQKKFIARTDIVFDENKSYETSEINELLAPGSDNIEQGMLVEIVDFTPVVGISDELPEVIHNAGNYQIKVTVGSVTESTISLTVAQKTVDLGDYSQLSWRVKGEEENTELGGETSLYIYDMNGREYPSTVILSDSQLTALNISGNYAAKQVLYSAARYTGNEITLCIESNPAFTISYPGGEATFTDVGAYSATATLVASPNYNLTVGTVNSMRGLTITDNDGSYTVTKSWYIVNLNNWLVDANGADYKINDFIYGQNPPVGAPELKFNNSDGSAPSFNLELWLNGEKIGDTFTPEDFGNYINNSMPAGEYKLIATVGAVIVKDGNEEEVYHAGFTETCTFKVGKKTLQNLGNFNKVLQDENKNTFVYKWDGRSHFFEQSAEATAAYENFLAQFYMPARIGVWQNYEQYYGTPVITYNLSRMLSTEYISADAISTNDADTYVVYYKISALNYYDSLEISFDENRAKSCFTVINIKEVALPVVNSKTYTGETILADINVPSDDTGNPLYYNVITNNGGVQAGSYQVVLELIDPVHYMWEGQTLENKTENVTLNFTIDKSPDNYFTTTLSITSWVVGKYGELEEFPVVGEARFGDVVFTLSYSDDIENVIYSGANNTEQFKEALAGLGAGSYILTARVAGSSDYNELTDVITFRVFDKDGLPWWAVLLIAVGALGAVALVFFILHQKGVLQMLTGKVIIAMRAKATVDATIAAVRANKVASEAKKTVAKAEARDRLEALREAKANAKNMTAEEQAAALEEKAQAAAKNAEKFQKRAKNMQKRADKIKSDLQDAQAQAEQTVASDEQSEQTSGEQPKEEN